MKTMTEAVKQFHDVYNVISQEIPQLPDNEVRRLRKSLITEEFTEYLIGEKNNNIVEIADALADLLYVTLGTAISYGIPIDAVFAEVQRSNLSKLGEDGKPLYRADGKVLKGPGFFQPDIAKVLREHGGNV